MQTKLQDASGGYNKYLRWGDLDRASEYLPGLARNAFIDIHTRAADDLIIVDYQITRLQLDKERGVASSRAEISWHTDRRLIVEETEIEQTWQWFEGGWVLVDERRRGGAPLAIFAEPEEDPHPYLPGLEQFRVAHEIGQDNRNGR